MSKITEIVKALAEPVAANNGCELWDVEYIKEAGTQYLRVFIDREDGVSIGLCEDVSKELDPLLDEYEEIFPAGYTFEVSSAGAERWLRGPSDYERFTGSLVEVKLYKSRDGKKSYTGILAGTNDGGALLDISGERCSFEKAEIAGVRLRIKV